MSDTEYQDTPVCPHCGYAHSNAWEWDLGTGLEGSGVFECDDCGKEFSVERIVTIEYTTQKTESKGRHEMSDQEINIAIAEACGWKIHPKDRFIVIPPNSPHSVQPLYTIPDYCNDLNAIRDAVMTLPENKQVLYGAHLAWACGHTDKGSVGLWKISTATAYHHAVAFLKTLEKWEETK